LEQQAAAQISGEQAAPELTLKSPQEPVYVLMDGSLIYCRKQGWKEIKLARLFNAGCRAAVQQSRNELMQSLYVCHLGGHRKFLDKLQAYTEPYAQKVFIADGAKWIWNWVEDCYEGAVQILDFYHVLEKLGIYACLQFSEQLQRSKWMETQKEVLLGGGVEQLIAELGDTQAASKEAGKAKKEVLSYYQNNKSRMQYHLYRQKGYMIGSGAIEAAHRNVIQQRLKLSGQRWSVKGAQQIANLRACKKSKQWNKLIQLINSAA
jgi:hypothetical protein